MAVVPITIIPPTIAIIAVPILVVVRVVHTYRKQI